MDYILEGHEYFTEKKISLENLVNADPDLM